MVNKPYNRRKDKKRQTKNSLSTVYLVDILQGYVVDQVHLDGQDSNSHVEGYAPQNGINDSSFHVNLWT